MCFSSRAKLADDKPSPSKASARAETASDVRKPKGQVESQNLAARLGTAQLRALIPKGF